MTTITLEIKDPQEMRALKTWAKEHNVNIVSLPNEDAKEKEFPFDKYFGSMTQQPIEEVNRQLDELRNAWE